VIEKKNNQPYGIKKTTKDKTNLMYYIIKTITRKGRKPMFEKVMMITNTMIMLGVWISLIVFNDWKHLF